MVHWDIIATLCHRWIEIAYGANMLPQCCKGDVVSLQKKGKSSTILYKNSNVQNLFVECSLSPGMDHFQRVARLSGYGVPDGNWKRHSMKVICV